MKEEKVRIEVIVDDLVGAEERVDPEAEIG